MKSELTGFAPGLERRRTLRGRGVGWLVALGAVSCSGGATWSPPRPLGENPAVVYQLRISGRESYVDIARLPEAFRRVSDPYVGPAYVLYAADGQWACLVSGAEFVYARDGALWPCRWRRAR